MYTLTIQQIYMVYTLLITERNNMKTIDEALQELADSLQEAIDILTNWFDTFTTWVAEALLEVMTSLIAACESMGLLISRTNNQVKIMRKKIKRYLEYKKLALWLVVTKGKK